MSADNYLYVAPKGAKFVIVDRSASCDHRLNIAKYEHVIEEHDSVRKAVARAHVLDQGEHWTEYGVSLHPKVLLALDSDEASLPVTTGESGGAVLGTEAPVSQGEAAPSEPNELLNEARQDRIDRIIGESNEAMREES